MNNTVAQLEQLAENRAGYAGLIIETYAFGLYTMMTSLSVYFLLQRHRKTRGRTITLSYIAFMMLVTIAWFYCSADVVEQIIVEAPYLASQTLQAQTYCSALNTAGNAFSILQFWGSDALMLYRLHVIFEKRWTVTVWPAMIYLASIGAGIVALLGCYGPDFGGTLHLAPIITTATLFYSLTAAFNLISTVMICAKLLWHRRQVAPFIGSTVSTGTKDSFVSITGILAESAAFYTVSCIVFLALSHMPGTAASWWAGILSSSSFLCQGWIILRIAMGTAVRTGSNASSTARDSATVTNWAVAPRGAMHTRDSAGESAIWQDSKVYHPETSHTMEMGPVGDPDQA